MHVAPLVHEAKDGTVTTTTDRERVDERTLEALAVSRATGAPWLACMLGVGPVPATSADSELRILPLPGPFPAKLAVLDMAMLADLALGAALRAQLGRELIMPTLTLSVELSTGGTADGLLARAWSSHVGSRSATAHGELCSGGGERVGLCLATFAVPKSPIPATPLPWENSGSTDRRPPGALDPWSLTVDEREVLEAVRAVMGSACLSGGCSLTEALAASACSGHTAGTGQTQLRPSSAMLNRSGRVQGGVLFGVAAAAARAAGHDVSLRVASGHMQFVRAAAADEVIDVSTVVQWSGRQFLFAQTDLHQNSQLVATGNFRLQRDA